MSSRSRYTGRMKTLEEKRLTQRNKMRRYRATHPGLDKRAHRSYNEAHPGREAASRRARTARYKAWLAERKAGGCADCGAKLEPAKLSFHHLDPSTKLFKISMGHTRSTESVAAELEKTVLVCEPCHVKRHVELRAA